MSALFRALSVIILVVSLSCAGPIEEIGPFRSDAELRSAPSQATHSRVVIAVPVTGQHPVPLTQRDLEVALQLLGSQLQFALERPTETGRLFLLDLPRLDAQRERAFLPDHGLSLPEVPFHDARASIFPQRSARASAHLVLADFEKPDELTRRYLRHCQEIHAVGDCSGAMDGHPYVTFEGRRRIALHFALASVLSGAQDELRNMLDPGRLTIAIICSAATYMALVAIPEPFSKIIAVGLTIAMTAWLGAEALWNLTAGWVEMVRAADMAQTFDELRVAGEKYGHRVGVESMRVLVMLVAMAISKPGLTNLPKLPGFASASMRLAAATGGDGLEMVAQAQTVVVAEGGVTIVLAKATQSAQAGVAVAASTAGGGGPSGMLQPAPKVDLRIEVSRKHWGAAAEHMERALASGKPKYLRIDRTGKLARREAALQSYPEKPGLNRDEYPPAMFKEGGRGASVEYIDPGSNKALGAYIGNLCRRLPDDSIVEIVIVP